MSLRQHKFQKVKHKSNTHLAFEIQYHTRIYSHTVGCDALCSMHQHTVQWMKSVSILYIYLLINIITQGENIQADAIVVAI